MNEISNFVYFLNSIKKILPFDDEDDFIKQINENKNFRIKVQKLVYLSKFFGWDNQYIFTLNVHGPYSFNLAENYNDNNLFNENAVEITDFSQDSFIDFVKEKSNDFLEATSTILYVFKNKKDSFTKKNCISLLNDLKPNISDEIKINAYDEIKKLNLLSGFNNLISAREANTIKSKLNKSIIKIQGIVEPLEICRNHTLILGSLEYMVVVMKIEHLEYCYKKDLLQFIGLYVSKAEDIMDNLENFINLDLTILEELFNQFQDYVSVELNIIPRVDDDDFNYAEYY